jgi:hypothetical protein
MAASSQRAQSISGSQPGLNFTAAMRGVCQDMVARLPELAHIDVARVAISFSQTRKAVTYGMQASLTPMRFENGALSERRAGRSYAVQRLYDASGRELLYILNFYLPRYLNLPLEEKLSTVVHELWHISPDFNGDLRRHGGRCYAHGPSQKAYDAHTGRLAERWLAFDPPAELYQFLRGNFRQLLRRHGAVYGTRIPVPKLLPLER